MNKKFLTAGLVCLVLCAACAAGYFILHRGSVKTPQPIKFEDVTVSQPTTVPADSTAVTDPDATEAKAPYLSPIDFNKLKAENKDIYAWLMIPGTTISDLVVQSPTDDNQYLRHDIYGNYTIAGTLFTEHVYNGKTFDDRVTIIYGHHMLDDTMFGNLQMYYSDADTFEQYKEIVVYLADKELHYEVFAAVPFSNQHILYHYNSFPTQTEVDTFLQEIYRVRGFGVNRRDDVQIGEQDRLLILSTCLQGDRTRRYLVISRLTDVLS